jgi:hypothetical protein
MKVHTSWMSFNTLTHTHTHTRTCTHAPGGRRRGDASLAASDGRFSPPPVDPAELAAGELDVVGEEEDLRMLELQRQQVRYSLYRQGWWGH